MKCKCISAFIIILMLSSCFLVGCKDLSEVDDNVYAVIIGIDKGSQNKMILTIQYPTYKASAGASFGNSAGTDSHGSDSNVHSIECASLLDGISMMNMAISRKVSLSHGKMLVISEELAKEGISQYLSSFEKNREARPSMTLVISRGKALDFIKENKSNIAQSITKSIELLISQSNSTGFFPKATFYDFYRDMTSLYCEPVAIYAGINNFNNLNVNRPSVDPQINTEPELKPGGLPRIGVAKREFVGTAVFLGDKMVGSLSPFETQYYLMLTGKLHTAIMTIEDTKEPNTCIDFNIRLGRPTKINAQFENGKPVINATVNIEAEIDSIQSRFNYETPSGIVNLNSELEKHICIAIKRLVKKTQEEYKTDIFGFGCKVAGNFSTIQQWEKYNWPLEYPNSTINVNVLVNIRRSGQTIKSSPIIKNIHK